MTAALLEELPRSGTVEIELDGRPLTLSSLDKVLWPAAEFTKRDLFDYYARIAPVLLPQVAGRPLTLARFPEGVERYGWYQTNTRTRPDWLPVQPVRVGEGETQHYCVLNETASLLWAANIGGLELHPFLARAEAEDDPTVVVFDLDPGPPATVVDCSDVALLVREAVRAYGLDAFAKTTGSIGLHVYVPLNSGHTYAETRAFAREIAQRLADRHPALVVAKTAKSLRTGKVLIDWAQNHAHKSTVAAYSLRALSWPTVATPVSWHEVEEAAASRRGELLTFGPAEVLERVERFGDLFAPVLELEQRLPG